MASLKERVCGLLNLIIKYLFETLKCNVLDVQSIQYGPDVSLRCQPPNFKTVLVLLTQSIAFKKRMETI